MTFYPPEKKKPKYEGHESVPDNPKGGTITAIGIISAFLIAVIGSQLAVQLYGPRDENGNLPQGSQRIEFPAND